jgi:hypothetical protein
MILITTRSLNYYTLHDLITEKSNRITHEKLVEMLQISNFTQTQIKQIKTILFNSQSHSVMINLDDKTFQETEILERKSIDNAMNNIYEDIDYDYPYEHSNQGMIFTHFKRS